MTDHEKAFNRWKEETRREALEKELARLQKEDFRKSRILKKMRNGLIILSTLLLLSFIYIVVWGTSPTKQEEAYGKNEQILAQKVGQPKQKKRDSLSVKKDSLTIEQLNIVVPGSDTIRFNVPDDGIFFSVQVGAYMGIDMSKFKNYMVSLHQVEYGGLNQFTLGILPTYEDAVEFRDIVKTIGFEQAYITAIQNGKRINIQEAIQQREKTK
jgi:hypothetical protein